MLEIVGYADKMSVHPGETLEIKVSCEAGAKEFSVELIRIICGDDSSAGPGYMVEKIPHPANKTYFGRRRPIKTGSFVRLPPNEKLAWLSSFTLQAHIWPTTPAKGRQTILGGDGFRLMLDEHGALALEAGGRIYSTETPLSARRWYFVAARYDAPTGELQLFQEPQKGEALTRRFDAVPAAKADAFHIADGSYNGKIEAPRIALHALTRAEMDGAPPEEYLGAWDFSRDISGIRCVDISGKGWHGETVNLPTRAVTGQAWTGEFTSWREKPPHYGAIHFHDDDLYDAGWQTDFALKLPDDLKSGIYAVRLTCAPSTPERADEAEAFVTFFVSPKVATAPVAFLASTATYLAYANSHHGWRDALAEICYGVVLELGPTEQFLQSRPEFGLSTYDLHSDGSGCCYSSRLRPILNLRPKHSAWNFGADTHITHWLESSGQAYDLITDDDLHQMGAEVLKRYRCVITGTHPEYYTPEMLRGVEEYLDASGRLMYMGGNGFYWHTAYHPALPGAIEIRRAENGSRTWAAAPGEYHLSTTGRMSGLWANCGFAPQKLVGVGYASTGFDSASWYRRLPDSFDPRAAFIFQGVGKDEKIGNFGSLGGAAGYELDIVDPSLGTPDNCLRLASSENHSNAYVMTPERMLCNYPGADGVSDPSVRADMVFFETPAGGAVFSTGSITWSASLAHQDFDNNVAKITNNVLRRFLDEKKF